MAYYYKQIELHIMSQQTSPLSVKRSARLEKLKQQVHLTQSQSMKKVKPKVQTILADCHAQKNKKFVLNKPKAHLADKIQDHQSLHTGSQIKKLINITSEKFVICKDNNFENDYEIIGKIGQGSFGAVFRVRHRTLKLERALKKIKKNEGSQFSSFEEIQILKKLDHRNILKIFQFYNTEDQYLIVTEIFEGRELFDEIVDCGKMCEALAARVIEEILQTLYYTHSLGIAHRDIKPENILVRSLGEDEKMRIKLIDWGLGTLIKDKQSDRVCGTPEYAAPEVFQGKYSALCDMWSLGVLVFVILTGNMPFKGSHTQETITQVKKANINFRRSGFNELSDSAKEFITALIQKDPSKRLTAQDALKHRWLTEHRISLPEPKYLKQTLQRLKSFNSTNHFGSAVINLVNNHFSSSEEKDRLQQIFKFLDSNGDGFISKQELIQGYISMHGTQTGPQIAEQTFTKLDVNNSGTIQFSEFIAYGLRRQKQKEQQKLLQAFLTFDVDKNGKISCKQMSTVLEDRLGGLYQQDLKDIIQQISNNADSEVNFEEFYQFMQNILQKVDIIRSSMKQSLGSSHLNKPKHETKKDHTIALKHTSSASEQIQPQSEPIVKPKSAKKNNK